MAEGRRVAWAETAALGGFSMSGDGLTWRVLGAADWRLYRAVRIRALECDPDAFSSTLADALARSEATWRERLALADPAREHPIVALLEGAAVGLVWGRIDGAAPAVAHVTQMWVAPEARGRGFGRQLLHAVIDWARARGALSVELGVTQGNHAATALYASAGFDRIGAGEPLRPGSDLQVQSMRLVLR